MSCGSQSISSKYGGASLIGPTLYTDDDATGTDHERINLVPVPTDGTPFVPAVFAVSLTNGSSGSYMILKQGDVNVVADTTGTEGVFTQSMKLFFGTVWRVDVNTPDQAYLDVTSDIAARPQLQIVRVDSLSMPGTP